MIHNIIFDIGQVLAEFRWKEHIASLGFDSLINERVAKATVLSPYWKEIDKGVLTTKEIIELCVALDPALEEPIRLFFKDTSKMVVEFDYSKDWLCELKEQGYHIYILSNYGEDNFAHVKDVFQFLKYVDGAVVSYQEKCIKPDPRIYQALLDRYQLIPTECVFLDDLLDNIKGASEFGIHTIHFINQKQAKEELLSLGVKERVYL